MKNNGLNKREVIVDKTSQIGTSCKLKTKTVEADSTGQGLLDMYAGGNWSFLLSPNGSWSQATRAVAQRPKPQEMQRGVRWGQGLNRWSRQSIYSNVMCDGGKDSLSRAPDVDDTHRHRPCLRSPCVISQGNLLVSVLPRSNPQNGRVERLHLESQTRPVRELGWLLSNLLQIDWNLLRFYPTAATRPHVSVVLSIARSNPHGTKFQTYFQQQREILPSSIPSRNTLAPCP